MKTSDRGIRLIKEFEGFRADSYICPAGKRTIGYGHVIQPGDHIKEPMTEASAHDLLVSDLSKFEAAVNREVAVPLSQQQFDALVSLAFNIGVGAFTGSTLLKRLNAERFHDAAAQFDKWVYSNKKKIPGLVKRRKAEKELFLDGTKRPRLKPLAKSREILGSTMATLGTAGNVAITDAKEAIEPVADYSDTLRWIFIALVFAGIALNIYGRVSNRRRGLV